MVRGSRELINDKSYKVELRMNPMYWFDTEPTQKDELLETYTDANGYYKLYHLSRQPKAFSTPEHSYAVRFPDLVLDETFRGDGRMEFFPIEGTRNHDDAFFFSGFKGVANQLFNKKAWIRLHIENVNPQPGDFLYVNFPTARFQNNLYGYVNDTITLLGIGNANNSLHYSIRKGNGPVSQVYVDSIMLGEMDTTYYKFEY